MRICIPIPFKAEGGGQYFLQSFRAFLSSRGHQAVDALNGRFDVLFTNHWLVPLNAILRAVRHNPRVRIVQRIDGAATDYGRIGDADQRQHEVNQIADLTVFQSEYCRWSTREKFAVIGRDGPVINNPVDLQRFSPQGPREALAGTTRLAVVSWSTNPRKGAASVYQVARQSPDVDFYLSGRFVDVPALPNIHDLGVVDRDRLPIVLRSCHALLTFSENEACPNHVLEALASGLPVLFVDSGAMREVIGDCGCAVTVDTVRAPLAAVMNDWQRWSERSRQRAVARFDPEKVFPRYIAAIEGALAAPLAVPERERFVWALGGRLAAWWLGRHRWDRRTSAACL